MLDLEARTPRRGDTEATQLGYDSVAIGSDRQLRLPPGISHSYQRPIEADGFFW